MQQTVSYNQSYLYVRVKIVLLFESPMNILIETII